jgi:response regulator RpfG family c-di-GMP phosphodiesterase
MRKLLWATALACGLALAGANADARTVRWAASGDPNTLDPHSQNVGTVTMVLQQVYDALISRRVYKPAFSFEQARDTILAGRASHFDPDIVDAFVAVEPQFREIAGRFAD